MCEGFEALKHALQQRLSQTWWPRNTSRVSGSDSEGLENVYLWTKSKGVCCQLFEMRASKFLFAEEFDKRYSRASKNLNTIP